MSATNAGESSALATRDQSYNLAVAIDATSLILGPSFERVQVFSELMCKGNVSVPKHLRGNMGDCMAVTIQALSLGFNPFAFAQKTHLTQSGALGYEGQLVSAILTNSRALTGDPEYEHIGDWSKVLGKVEERQSNREGGNGGKYYVATYTKEDEAGLGVIVRATLRGESKPRELTVMMSQAYPRFSTQWATDPRQQICNLAIRKFTRLHKPGVLLGFKFTDEEDDEIPIKHMGPADEVRPAAAVTYPQKDFDEKLPAWTQVIETGRKTADDLIAMIETTLPLTDAQKKKLRDVKVKPKANKASAQDVEPKTKPDAAAQQSGANAGAPAVTFAKVADQIAKAIADKNTDALNEAGDLIGAVEDAGQRKELAAQYDAGVTEISSAN
jgi:hypothetical protein